jgi:hypothetical protein
MRDMFFGLGKRYGLNPTVTIVAVPNGTSYSGDWSVPHQPVDVAEWKSGKYSYTTDKLLAACEGNIDVLAAAFPNSAITMACGLDGALDTTPMYACEGLANYGVNKYGSRWAIQLNRVNCVSPSPAEAYGTIWQILAENMGKIVIRGQPTWFAHGDPTYRDNRGRPIDANAAVQVMLNLAGEYGMKDLELYQSDAERLPSITNP